MDGDKDTLAFIDETIKWYDRSSRRNRLGYLFFKSTQLVCAAAIPILSLSDGRKLTIAIVGASIGIIEGFLQVGHFYQNWTSYRSTCESLKVELFLFRSGAGGYAAVNNPLRVLAERASFLISTEHSKWQATQEKASAEKSKLTHSGAG